MNRIFSLCLLMTLLTLAACGGGSDDPTPTTAAPLPPMLGGTSRPPDAAFPPIASTSSGPSGSVPPFASMPTPQAPGDGSTVQVITDFSTLTTGDRVTLSGRLELRQEEGGEPSGVLVDAQGNEVLLTLPPFMVIEMDGEEAQYPGVIAPPLVEGGRLVLQVNAQGASNPNVPAFLAQQSTPPFAGGQNSPLPAEGTTATAPGVVANSQFVPLDTRLNANLTALQAYDALQTAFAQELTGKVWLSLAGNATLGWTVEFTDPTVGTGILYQVNPDGSVLRREVASASQGIVPIERARVVVDSPQVEAQIGANAATALLALRALEGGVIEWGAIGMDIPPIDATTP